MRRRSSVLRGLAVLAICLGVVLAGAAAPARAGSVTQLPPGLHEPWMVVDADSQHVFVSSGVGGSVIDVLNFDGSLVKTITGESGASQMAVDPTTHTLYVALYSSNAISEIDTQTLTETTRFSTAPYANPYSLVIASGKLWFSGIGGSGFVASANLDGTGVAASGITAGLPALLSAGGSNNHLLATAYYGGSPSSVSLYDVSSGSPTQITGPQGDPEGQMPCDLGDFSVSPSGAHVLFASPCLSHAAALATDYFGGTTYEYPSLPTPNAVAWSPDGQYVAIGSAGGGGTSSTIQVFPTTSAQPAWGWTVGAAPHDLAFSPDGKQVFAIVSVNGGAGFQVLDPYTTPDTLITSGPAAASSTYATWASFDFSSHAAPATFECNLDGSGWASCTSPQDFYDLLPGSHTFAVRSTVGGTVDPVGASRTWTIQPPNTKITSGPSAPTTSSSASFAFTSDDPYPVDYMCQLDGGAWQECFSPQTYTNLGGGSHTFQVKAQDWWLAADVDPVGASRTWMIIPRPQLSVFTAGQGFGAVTSNPAGIACNPTCAASFASGTMVTLTATPAVGSIFAGWSGACSGTGSCVVTMTQARTVAATFSLPSKQKLTITKSGKGTVSSVPAGITCGSTCSHSYSYGTPVTLKAVAASGFAFAGWSGACTGTSPTCQLTMTAARAATAKFARPKLLTVLKIGTGGGTVKSNPAGISCGSTCKHKFAAGTGVTLTATAKAGSTFAGWLGACTGTGSCTVTMSAAKKVKASFTR